MTRYQHRDSSFSSYLTREVEYITTIYLNTRSDPQFGPFEEEGDEEEEGLCEEERGVKPLVPAGVIFWTTTGAAGDFWANSIPTVQIGKGKGFNRVCWEETLVQKVFLISKLYVQCYKSTVTWWQETKHSNKCCESHCTSFNNPSQTLYITLHTLYDLFCVLWRRGKKVGGSQLLVL